MVQSWAESPEDTGLLAPEPCLPMGGDLCPQIRVQVCAETIFEVGGAP
jgi:hypothetical protein